MKVLLANSVGIGPNGERFVHFPSRWSAVEEPSWYDHKKGWMTFYPFMLAYCSSLLKRDSNADVKFLDGNLNNWNHNQYLAEMLKENPDWLIMESSTLSFPHDIKLAKALKTKTNCKLVFTGQHPSAFPKDVLKEGADFVTIGEYEMTILDLVDGNDPSSIKGLYPNQPRKLLNPNDLPWPEDDDVRRIDYIEPVVNEYRELEMFASRGCPLACNFCVASNIYYKGAGSWRPRDVDDVTNEIQKMLEKYSEMEGVFFDDEVHNGRKDFTIALCKSIIAKGLDKLKYNAMCGYWNMDEEMLAWMKKAGYYKLRIGIETADKGVAKEIGKSHSIKRLYNALKSAKKVGIKMYGTFTYGAKGSSKETDEVTTKLIADLLKKELLFDLQISICTPQPGTPFFESSQKSGLLTTKKWDEFDGGRNVIQSYPHYKAEEILKTVSKARRTASIYGGHARFKDVDFSPLQNAVKEKEKIIVIGSGPKWQTDKIVGEIEKEPDRKYQLFVRKELQKEYKTGTLSFSEGSLSLQTISNSSLQKLIEFNPSLVIIQINHNSQDLCSYSNILKLAERISDNAIGINIDGHIIEGSQLVNGVE